VVVFNMHMMPEVDLGPMEAESLRMYQFSEIANQAKEIDARLHAADAAYSIIIGGDYNEDAYHLNHRSPEVACERMGDVDVNTKFHALNFDLEHSCRNGLVGAPTWDPTHNDLAGRFSRTGKHEVLDYLIEYANSEQVGGTPNLVHNVRYTPGWSGQFCDDALQGVLGGTARGTAHSLSDHNAVVARFALPPLTGTSVDATGIFQGTFDQFPVQAAACGQADTQCMTDSNCCRSPEYAFDGNGYQCNHGVCERAKLEGERCQWMAQGSECLGYDTYPGGLHCESGTCVRKYRRGQSCLYDHECDSRDCHWTWRGRKCG